MTLEEFYSFDNRVGKIRGANTKEKLATLQRRYKKTHQDSVKEFDNGNDTSKYRVTFGKVHGIYAEAIPRLCEYEDALIQEKIREGLTKIVEDATALMVPHMDNSGSLDAYAYIHAELAKVIADV